MPYYTIPLTEEEAEFFISFIKSHEGEDIPDGVWDVCMMCMKLMNLLYEVPGGRNEKRPRL